MFVWTGLALFGTNDYVRKKKKTEHLHLLDLSATPQVKILGSNKILERKFAFERIPKLSNLAVSPTPLAEELTVRRGSVGLGRSKSVRCSRVKFGLVSLDDDDGDGEGDDGSAKGKSRGTCDGFIARASVIVAIGGERQDQKEEEATLRRRTNCGVPFGRPWRRWGIIRDLKRRRPDGRTDEARE